MTDLGDTLSLALAEFGQVELRLIETATLIALLVITRAVLARLINRNVEEPLARYHWTKAVSYAVAFVGIILVGRIWFVGFRSVATILGLVAAGLVISLKEPVMNVAGWVFLL
jgi:small-conductance mechanosensitive channel